MNYESVKYLSCVMLHANYNTWNFFLFKFFFNQFHKQLKFVSEYACESLGAYFLVECVSSLKYHSIATTSLGFCEI